MANLWLMEAVHKSDFRQKNCEPEFHQWHLIAPRSWWLDVVQFALFSARVQSLHACIPPWRWGAEGRWAVQFKVPVPIFFGFSAFPVYKFNRPRQTVGILISENRVEISKARYALTFSLPYLIVFVDCNVMECIAQRLADLEEMYNRQEYYFHSFFL